MNELLERLYKMPRSQRFLTFGVGYILIQVALIQKFVLFLGHPTYALTVIIFSMLVSSGLGSFLSGKYIGTDDGKLMVLDAKVGFDGNADMAKLDTVIKTARLRND